MIYLVEHFYSIQGEGRYVGTPSLFFRFGGCNMKCEGFGCSEIAQDGTKVLGCDTVYAVNKEHFSHNWIPVIKAQELLGILELYELPNAVDVVLTGGEPLIYANDSVFSRIFRKTYCAWASITLNDVLDVDFEKLSYL